MKTKIKRLNLIREAVKRIPLRTGLRAGDPPPARSNNSTVLVADDPPKTSGNTEV